MESPENAFVASMQKKKRQKRIRNLIVLGVVVVALIVGVIVLLNALNAPESTASVLTYQVAAVSEGEISTTLSGSGTLTALKSETFSAPADATVESVEKQPGDKVMEGDLILTLSSDSVEEQLDELYDELFTLQTQLSSTTQARTSLDITATKKGVVKDIRVQPGDAAEDFTYLCVIATDGKMKTVIDAPDGMKKYDAVQVTVDGETLEGTVTELTGGKATIVIESDEYSVGAAAAVSDESGTPLGAGTLAVNEHVSITAAAGRIEEVHVSENDSVRKGAALFTLSEGAPTATYAERKKSEQALLDEIEALEDSLAIRSSWDGTLTSLSVAAGDELVSGATLCVLNGTDGYTLTMSIDELDISTLALGQAVSVTLDAVEGTFSGTVTNISYAGSGTYVTSYTATVTTDPIEGAYPGMSASAEITTATSGDSLIVSVGAVQYDDDGNAFVYLAGDDATAGTVVSETELDLDALTKLTVTTGMSNGAYIAITAEGLEAGDLIYVPNLATTAVYSADEETTVSFSGFGGGEMGGGQMPSGDFSGQRPSGNYGGGQMGSGGGFPGGN